MKTTEDITLVTPCGLYCGDCGVYKAKDDPSLLEQVTSDAYFGGVSEVADKSGRGKCFTG